MKRIRSFEPKSKEELVFLTEEYLIKHKGPETIAKQCKVSESLVWNRLAAHGLSKSECKQKLYYCPSCGQCVGKQLFLQLKSLQK